MTVLSSTTKTSGQETHWGVDSGEKKKGMEHESRLATNYWKLIRENEDYDSEAINSVSNNKDWCLV